MNVLHLIGALVTLTGSLFFLLGTIGLVRMPDFYNRVQAGTKATTLGAVLSVVGLGFFDLTWMPKLLLIALFVLLTNPLSSHALARAVHRAGLPLADGSVKDDLKACDTGDAKEVS